MSRRTACHKSRSRGLSPVAACYMCSLSISLKRHSQTNKSGPQRNKHVHRLVPSTPSCTGYMCHRLPPAARSAPASAPARTLLPPMRPRNAVSLLRISPAISPRHAPCPPAVAPSGLATLRRCPPLYISAPLHSMLNIRSHRCPAPPPTASVASGTPGPLSAESMPGELSH